MKRRTLDARRVVVIAPHPDDEAIGAWELMRRLHWRGARVDIVVVSDGAASHLGSRRWPVARLCAERRRETLRAMATLRIAPARVRFLSLPDGALENCGRLLTQSLAASLRRRPVPDLIVGPVPGDAHADHCAVAEALARLPRRGEQRLGYQVWPDNARRSGRGPCVSLDGRALCVKRRIVRSYRTQTGMIVDAGAGFTMTSRHLKGFVRPVERFDRLA